MSQIAAATGGRDIEKGKRYRKKTSTPIEYFVANETRHLIRQIRILKGTRGNIATSMTYKQARATIHICNVHYTLQKQNVLNPYHGILYIISFIGHALIKRLVPKYLMAWFCSSAMMRLPWYINNPLGEFSVPTPVMPDVLPCVLHVPAHAAVNEPVDIVIRLKTSETARLEAR